MQFKPLSALALVLLLSGLVAGRADDIAKAAQRPGPKSRASASGKPKKYDEVITKDAKTTPGVFTVHRIDDKLYFEIPESAFGRLMLWRTEVAKGPAGVSWGGMSIGNNVVRWDRRGNKVYLWKVGFAKRADGKAVRSSVESANQDTIAAAFNVEAEGKDRSTVILTTPLFTTDISDLSVKRAVGTAGGVDESRSYLAEVKAFPTNIEVRSLLTFRGAGSGGRGRGPAAPAASAGPGRSSSALVHYSLAMLPEKPMKGRYLRSPRRLLHRVVREVRRSQAVGGPASIHHPLSAGKEGTRQGRLRAGQTDRLLSQPGNPREMAALPEKGRRGLEAGLRESGLQERHRLQGRPDAERGSDLGSRGRALVGHPLGRRTDRQRHGA